MGRKPLKIVALYKTFDGGEWVKASIESIYNHVDSIVMVHSYISWDGVTEKNNVIDKVKEWEEKSDDKKKIIHLHTDLKMQVEQYDLGMTYINQFIEHDFVMLIDCDEVWHDENWDKAKVHLQNQPANSFQCKMHTYIKTPFYRVIPPERANPTVFFRKGCQMEGVRGNKIKPKYLMDNVFFHHFTLVRENFSDIKRKIVTSNQQDGAEHVDVDKWIRDVWYKIPQVHNFHISKGYESSWAGLTQVTKADLPEVLRKVNHPIVTRYEYILARTKEERHEFAYETIKSNPVNFSMADFREREEYKIINGLVSPEDNILEIGCLNGRNLLCLYEDGYRNLTGIEMLKEAIDWARQQNPNIDWIHGYFPELPQILFFKKVILFDVLEHIPNVEKFLTSVHNLLLNDGEALIMVPKGTHYNDVTHVNWYPDLEKFERVLGGYFNVCATYEMMDDTKLLAICRRLDVS
jgi:2-polyprenyl-3-methyl-5-hydroxy-6-metoxy-1,4-benzoquinol methylase